MVKMASIDIITASDEEILSYIASLSSIQLESLVIRTGSVRLLRLLLEHNIDFTDNMEDIFCIPGFVSVYCELKPYEITHLEDYVLAEMLFPLCDDKAIKDVVSIKPENLAAAIELLKELSEKYGDSEPYLVETYRKLVAVCTENV